MAVDPSDLITLDTAYAWLKELPGSDDIVLQLAITAVSQRIASYCSRTFVVTDHVEVYDGTGGPRLLLRNFPVSSVASVEVDWRPVPAAASPLGHGFRHDGRRTLDLTGDVFARGRQNVRVTYRAGFDTIPADLQVACLDWLRAGYLGRDRDADIVSRKAGDTEEKFASGGAVVSMGGRTIPMPAGVYAALSQYQNTLPV